MKTEMPSEIMIRNLKFSYETGNGAGKGSAVLDIENLNIPVSGCRVILGPNGSGKTTLLKIIGGLLRSTAGAVEFSAGTVLVHQNPYLLSGSVFQNIAYGLKIRKIGRTEIKKRVETELEKWGLSHLKDRSSSKLSGGERQRTAIARAMVLRPEILLLDEPTASVDPENIIQMEDLIRSVSRNGTAVILSTHHLDFAYRMADSLIRLENGKPAPVQENIVIGRVTGRDESFNYFDSMGTVLYCPGRDGDFRRAVFSENDVILSKEMVVSSARNVLKAVVTDVIREPFDAVIYLNAGFDFKARISAASARELALNSESTIYALIKSSSINLY